MMARKNHLDFQYTKRSKWDEASIYPAGKSDKWRLARMSPFNHLKKGDILARRHLLLFVPYFGTAPPLLLLAPELYPPGEALGLPELLPAPEEPPVPLEYEPELPEEELDAPE